MLSTMWTVEAQLKRSQMGIILATVFEEHSCDILTENVTAFCPCPKNSPVSKLNSRELIYLAEEVSRQPNTDFIVWLLVITLMQVY